MNDNKFITLMSILLGVSIRELKQAYSTFYSDYKS